MALVVPSNRDNQVASSNLILAICCISVAIVSSDVTITNVALPAIQRDLHAGVTSLQWVVDSYTLVVASFLILSGSIADRVGRRTVLQIGLIAFVVASLLCSIAANIGQLIAFEILMGIGASMLNPVALSIIANAFPDRNGRGWAVGVWSAVSGVSIGLGPLIGGAMVQALGWRSIFWINIPIGIAAALLAARFVPESKAARPRAVDHIGQSLILVVLATLTGGIIEGPNRGWSSAAIVGLFIIAAATLTAFVLYELRRRDPLVDLRFFRSIPFSVASVLALLAFSCFAGFIFLNAFYLQQVRGFAPLFTGLFMLPLAIAMTISAPWSGKLVGRFGARPSTVVAGCGFIVSALTMTGLSQYTSLVAVVAAFALFGLGLGMVNPAISNGALAGMPLSQAGVAAAIASTCRQVGVAIGVAIAGTMVSMSRASSLDFAASTHSVWWVMTACGVIVLALGIASETAWARASVARVAYLFE